MTAHDIIIRPVLTEKSNDGVNAKRYVFMVDVRADKTQIKAAVESAFDVTVESVNVVNVRGKYNVRAERAATRPKAKKRTLRSTPNPRRYRSLKRFLNEELKNGYKEI